MAISQIVWSLDDQKPLQAAKLKDEAELEELLYPNAMLAKPSASRWGGFWVPLSSQSVVKPAGRVNHAMIHSLPTFPVYSEKVNHAMIHFFRKEVLPYES